MDSDDSDTLSNVSSSEPEDFPWNFNRWLDNYERELWFLKLAIVILMTLIQYGIIIMLYFIQITTGDRRDEGLVPMIRVLTIIAMAILGLAGYFRW